MMSPVSLIPIVPLLLIALATATVANTLVKVPVTPNRYHAIDGLRGFLAFAVFLHHGAVWYYYLRSGVWGFVPSNVYSHMGETAVAFFFMITALLFITKLAETKTDTVDWKRLYVSRLLRIYPLYVFALVVLGLLIAVRSNFTLYSSVGDIGKGFGQWLLFLRPDINRVGNTRMMTAGVTWSLAYETLFYLSLPFWGLVLFQKTARPVVIILTILLAVVYGFIMFSEHKYAPLKRISPFVGGIVTALVVKNGKFREFAASRFASWLVLIWAGILLAFANTFFTPVAYPCMLLIFMCVAGGNTVWGLLTLYPVCLLGQISYSVYLLHGLLLFTCFWGYLGFPYAQTLSPLAHWSIIAGCDVVLIILCLCTYQFIERPFIHLAGKGHKKKTV